MARNNGNPGDVRPNPGMKSRRAHRNKGINIHNELEEQARWRQKQEKRQRHDRNVKAIDGSVKAAGTIGAVAAYHAFLGSSARDFGEFVGETYEGMRVANRLLRPNSKDAEVHNYVARIEGDVGNQYLSHRDDAYLLRLQKAVEITLDAGGRASKKFPGAKSKPVKGIMDLKGRIIQGTKGIFSSEERKEEIALTNTDEYQGNYNALAEIRLNAIKRMRGLNQEIEDYCFKMAINEAKSGKQDQDAVKVLENLAKEHNTLATIAEGSEDLSVREVHKGMDEAKYKELIGQAQKYGLDESSFSTWGDVSYVSGAVLAGVLGYKASRLASGLIRGAYNIGRVGVSGTKKVVKGVNKIRKNRSKKSK